jgi:hypothetical protein
VCPGICASVKVVSSTEPVIVEVQFASAPVLSLNKSVKAIKPPELPP